MNDIFETDNFITIQNICTKARDKKRMYAIIGYEGAGKTIALQYFKRNHKNVYYVKLGKSVGIKPFYLSILNQLGLCNTPSDAPIGFILNKIAENLNANRAANLIIIDEAGKLKPGQLEHIHDLRDRTEHTTGIIVAGPGYFQDNVERWSEKNIVGIPEFHSRVYDFERLERPTKREVVALCKAYDIKEKKTINRIYKVQNNFRKITFEIERELEIRTHRTPEPA